MSIETIRQGLEEIFSLPLRRLTVSNPRAGAEYLRIQGRPVTLRGQELLQLEKFTKTQAFHENLPLSEGPARLEALLAHYGQLDALCQGASFCLKISKKGKLFSSVRRCSPFWSGRPDTTGKSSICWRRACASLRWWISAC